MARAAVVAVGVRGAGGERAGAGGRRAHRPRAAGPAHARLRAPRPLRSGDRIRTPPQPNLHRSPGPYYTPTPNRQTDKPTNATRSIYLLNILSLN